MYYWIDEAAEIPEHVWRQLATVSGQEAWDMTKTDWEAVGQIPYPESDLCPLDPDEVFADFSPMPDPTGRPPIDWLSINKEFS
jgi:hypothetical protein